MAISALHLSRNDGLREAAFPNTAASTLSRMSLEFFRIALEGYQTGLAQLNSQELHASTHVQLFEALYLASSMVSLCTLYQLGNDTTDAVAENSSGESHWFKLVMGTRPTIGQEKQTFGKESYRSSNVYFWEPNLNDANMAELFNPDNGTLLEPLLEWASKSVVLDMEEKAAYEHTISYLGLTYDRIRTGSESAQASCHRLRAVPARVPRRFGLAVVAQQPLALAILTYVFAMMKLLEEEIPWFCGTAERQVFLIKQKLPVGWWKAIQWPIYTADGSIEKKVELYVRTTDPIEG
jgi:hypothetical protein